MDETAIEFIETRLFSKQRDEILTDDEFREFQNEQAYRFDGRTGKNAQ